MLEDYLTSPVTRRRLREGPAAAHIDGFADWLHGRGYRRVSVESDLRSLAAWTDWLTTKSFGRERLVDGYEACRATLRTGGRVRWERGPNKHSLTAAALLIRFLREQGVLSAAPRALMPSERWPILEEFRRWTLQHRGVAESSMAQYESMVAEFLAALGADPATYRAESIRRFVVERARGHGIPRAQTITTAVRAFLRFLAANGQCSDDLLSAVPRFANWSLSSTPRFLEPEEVQRLIGVCSDGSALGARARAVILLLARLGLRASDVAGLTFEDIDWKNGRIAVCGKGRRHEWLPLPQEIGDAMLGYLRRGRAPLRVPQVFTSVLAPHQPMTRAAVTHVVRSALRQAGIKAPINGAHLLRHSAATAMLRSGASLAAVGAVLRHRSPITTAHYAKVDFGLLSEIAQPWPEVPPC